MRFPGFPETLSGVLRAGAFPRILDRGLRPHEFLADYVGPYVERDVRQMLRVSDLTTFQTSLRLVGGRIGLILNLASLGADAGVTAKTALAWLSVLEASWLVTRIQPWHANTNKRLVRSPKLHVLESGLLCWLLGIRSDDQLATHPLRGAVFESWVVGEVLKARANPDEGTPLVLYAEHGRTEVDLLVELPDRAVAVEVKSDLRVPPDAFGVFQRLETCQRSPLSRPRIERVIVHGGDGTTLCSWRDVGDMDGVDDTGSAG